MTELIALLETNTNTLVDLIGQYGLVIPFLAVFFLGETAIIILLTTTHQSELSLLAVIGVSCFATIAADTFWYAVGRYYSHHKSPGFIRQKFLSPINSFLARFVEGRFFLSLLLLKFMIGIRLILILHLARYRVSWPRFLAYDALGTLIYIGILALVSMQLTQFITAALPAFHTITTILSGLLVVVLLSITVHQILHKKMQNT